VETGSRKENASKQKAGAGPPPLPQPPHAIVSRRIAPIAVCIQLLFSGHLLCLRDFL
jgi:hypothetical protein